MDAIFGADFCLFSLNGVDVTSFRSTPMSRRVARWVAFISGCISGILALEVALSLGLFAWNGEPHGNPDFGMQSRQAAAAAAAAIVSVIAQIIEKASRSNEDR